MNSHLNISTDFFIHAAQAASVELDTITTRYWHKHTNEKIKDQPNEKNITFSFVKALIKHLDCHFIEHSHYFEATINAKRIDALLYLTKQNHFILIETKHLMSQEPEKGESIANDVSKMASSSSELSQRKHGATFTHIILADNWFDADLPTWRDDASIYCFSKSEHLIRQSDKWNWRLLLAVLQSA